MTYITTGNNLDNGHAAMITVTTFKQNGWYFLTNKLLLALVNCCGNFAIVSINLLWMQARDKQRPFYLKMPKVQLGSINIAQRKMFDLCNTFINLLFFNTCSVMTNTLFCNVIGQELNTFVC